MQARRSEIMATLSYGSISSSVLENTTVIGTPDVAPGAVQPITYALLQSQSPDVLLIHINQSTGERSFVNPPDFENPTDVGHDGTYNVAIVAFDGNGQMSAPLPVAVTVTDDVRDNPPNTPPTITTINVNGGGTQIDSV